MITATIDQPTFDALAAKLETGEGITLTGTSGTVTKSNATVTWSYVGGVLTMACTKAPFGLKGIVEAKLKDALTANGVVV